MGINLTPVRLLAACTVLIVGASVPLQAEDAQCSKTDFEAVVEQAAGSLRELNSKNKPLFQEKLRGLKDKRGWSHEQFLQEAAPFVRDDKIEAFDTSTEDLLSAISSMGQEGAAAPTPDCALLLELRARMKALVDTQTAKWAYMFEKIETEMWK
jgi:hypothetical protein